MGIKFTPDKSMSLDVHVDASFAGDYNTAWSHEPTSVMSRTGYIINYANCPIIWCSRLQTEIALSSTESEYAGLSYAMREAIPIMNLIQEMKDHRFPVLKTKKKVKMHAVLSAFTIVFLCSIFGVIRKCAKIGQRKNKKFKFTHF